MKILGALALVLALASPGWAFTVTLTWQDNSTDEDGFTVEKRNKVGADQTWGVLAQTTANITSVQDTVLTGEKFCYRVHAFNVAGISEWSNEACILANPYNVVI